MLHGQRITLRPIFEVDLDALYAAFIDIRNRGDYFPLGIVGEPEFRRDFAEHGFWEKDKGTLLIVSSGEIAGHIEFFKPVNYWDAYELSYQLYDHASPVRDSLARRSSSWWTTCSAARGSTAFSS